MSSPVAPLHFLPNPSPSPLDQVRDLVLDIAPNEGLTHAELPNLCIYRVSRTGTFNKAATFGVTLGVVLQGSKRFVVGSHEVVVDSFRLLVVTRASDHVSTVYCSSPDKPHLSLFMCFSPESVAKALLALAEAGETREEDAVPAFVTPCDDTIADALRRLVQALKDPLDVKLLAPLVREEILLRLLRSDAAAAVRSAVGQPADARRVLDAMQYIRDHHAEKLSVEELARRVAMSSSHFAHRFSAIARISPMRYLREVRLERARHLLLQHDVRASQAAAEVGFESPAHFTREFKRRFGVTPSHYLRAR